MFWAKLADDSSAQLVMKIGNKSIIMPFINWYAWCMKIHVILHTEGNVKSFWNIRLFKYVTM